MPAQLLKPGIWKKVRPNLMTGLQEAIDSSKPPTQKTMQAWREQLERIIDAYVRRTQIENCCKPTGKDCGSRKAQNLPCACYAEVELELEKA